VNAYGEGLLRGRDVEFGVPFFSGAKVNVVKAQHMKHGQSDGSSHDKVWSSRAEIRSVLMDPDPLMDSVWVGLSDESGESDVVVPPLDDRGSLVNEEGDSHESAVNSETIAWSEN
jgi:hypothetical protein